MQRRSIGILSLVVSVTCFVVFVSQDPTSVVEVQPYHNNSIEVLGRTSLVAWIIVSVMVKVTMVMSREMKLLNGLSLTLFVTMVVLAYLSNSHNGTDQITFTTSQMIAGNILLWGMIVVDFADLIELFLENRITAKNPPHHT